jgi:hypothetical protein
MADDKISQKEAHQLERRVDNANERATRKRFFISECFGGIGGGFIRGYALTKNPTLAGFGPGDRIHIDHVLAVAGLWLGRKQSKMGAIARGAGIQALGQIGNSYGEKAATESES